MVKHDGTVENEEATLSNAMRNARAYAWEVARHNQLIEKFEHICDDNPFSDPNWAQNIDPNEKDNNA